MRTVLEQARNSEYRVLKQPEIPPRQVKVTVTRIALLDANPEMWVEFSVTKGEGVIVGTHIFSLSSTGELVLKESHGTHFQVESSEGS